MRNDFFSFLRTGAFWFGLAVAIAVLWILEAYVPAFGSLTGTWDFIADVLVLVVVMILAENIYKQIKK